MSMLHTVPQLIADAAGDLAGIGSTISQANAAASGATTGLLPAAADEVSEAIAALFAGHGQAYQALGAQLTRFHDQFVSLMTAGAAQYASAEAANASPLGGLLAGAEQSQIGFGTSLASRELAFNQGLVANEVALERAIFGTDSALNGVVNRSFNVGNLLLGTVEQTGNSLLGVTVPGITPSLLLGSAAQTFNSGQIGGLVGAFDQALMVPTDFVGLLAGDGGPSAQALSAFGAAAAAPASPLQQLEAAELAFNSNLVNGQMAFHQQLLATELGFEQRVFGTDSALNGVLNRGFNAGNLLLGTGEQTLDSLLGAQVPENFTSSLLTGSAAQTFNGGEIGGLVGAFDQSVAAGANFVGLLGGDGISPAHLLSAAAAPTSPLGGVEQSQIGFGHNLVNSELAFNHQLLAGEVGLEQQVFGTDSALNGVVNRSFNVGNLLIGTVEQTANSFIGVQAPAGFTSSLLLGSAAQTFNGGQIGGLMGAFDQALMVPTDFVGLLAGDGGSSSVSSLTSGLASATPLQQLEAAEIAFNTNLVNSQMASHQQLLATEIGLERQVFGTDSALNGVVNRIFNVNNLMMGINERALDALLGAPVPDNFTASLLTGSGAQVFNGGEIGGYVGVFDQGLAAATDFVGLLSGDS